MMQLQKHTDTFFFLNIRVASWVYGGNAPMRSYALNLAVIFCKSNTSFTPRHVVINGGVRVRVSKDSNMSEFVKPMGLRRHIIWTYCKRAQSFQALHKVL